MEYKISQLKNGLKVLIVPLKSLSSVTLTVWVKTGSRNEAENVAGISHFLEHMVFKGSEKRPSAKVIADELDSMGSEHNAATSKDWTKYYIKCRSNDLEKAFDILSDLTLNPIFSQNEIEKEKGSIIEEIKMYEDTPMYHIGDVFEELVYQGTPLGRDIAGSKETVSNMKRSDFLKYRDSYYFSQNMLVTVAGSVDEKEVLNLSQKYFGDLKSGESHQEELDLVQSGPKFKLSQKEKEQVHVILGFLADGRKYKNKYAQTILATILGGGMSSRMFSEVREKRGLAYAVRTSMDRYIDTGYIGTYAGLDTKRSLEGVKIILEEHYKVVNGKEPIKESEVKKAKEFLKGHLALSLEDTSDVSSFFGEQQLFMDKVLTPKEVFKKIDSVSLEEINFEARRLFVPERLNLAVIGTFPKPVDFDKILKG